MAFMYFKFLDYDGEPSTVKFYFPDLTDGTSWTTAQTRLDAMRTAVEALSIGTLVQYGIDNAVDVVAALPSSPFAQRESKWFVPYVASLSGKNANFTIPAADLNLLVPNTKNADLADAAWVAFIAELENAFYNSPAGGDYEVGQPYHVGRNS